ncbi:MAG: SH3 domain-containing protein [Clostridia bacterium]|nr:SH3 domain-containing protein [Clostridia bacterium]
MASLRELARALHDAEAPLWTQYETLAGAAATDVERELVKHLVESQRFQLSFLELMTTPLPSRFQCFAKVTDDQVKLRQGPGAGHPLIGQLKYGTPCLIIDFSGYWANVQLPDGTRGWVFKDYVACERGGSTAQETPAWQVLTQPVKR